MLAASRVTRNVAKDPCYSCDCPFHLRRHKRCLLEPLAHRTAVGIPRSIKIGARVLRVLHVCNGHDRRTHSRPSTHKQNPHHIAATFREQQHRGCGSATASHRDHGAEPLRPILCVLEAVARDRGAVVVARPICCTPSSLDLCSLCATYSSLLEAQQRALVLGGACPNGNVFCAGACHLGFVRLGQLYWHSSRTQSSKDSTYFRASTEHAVSIVKVLCDCKV